MGRMERRRHPRLPICLPIAHRSPQDEAGAERHHFTLDVAAGGVCFAGVGPQPAVGQKLLVEMTVPPGEGHCPYVGRVHGLGTVLRCVPLNKADVGRWTAAAKFDAPLQLDF